MIKLGAEIHFRGLHQISNLLRPNNYAPGDGYIYFIASIRGQSDIKRLGLVHLSDDWKEHMLTYYELKKPARILRYPRRCVG